MFKKLCIPLLLASVVFGCSSEWMALKVEDVSYADLYDLTLHVIETEGFPPQKIDVHGGEILTGWDYSKITDTGRFPIRRRVEARVDPAGERTYLVKVRIDQEANWEGYRTMDPRESDAWDEYGWDRVAAGRILKKIEIQVKDYEPSDEFYKRHRTSEELRAKIPDVLDDRDG